MQPFFKRVRVLIAVAGIMAEHAVLNDVQSGSHL